MIRGRSRAAAAVLLALPLLCAAPRALAATDEEKEAQALFVAAMKLLATRQYGEACEKLARSQELDPGMGTQFRLAECYDKLGRVAGAFVEYTAVAEAAKAAGKLDREAVARRRAAALEPKVARLTITVPPSVAALPDLEVARDGAPLPEKLWGTPLAVEPGDHLITVRARGKKPWENKVWAEASAKHTVSIGSLEDDQPPPAPPRSRVPVIALGIAGGVGIVLGGVLVGLRAGKAGAAQTLHDEIASQQGNCVNGGMAAFTTDCAALARASSAGDAFGTASLVGFVAGGAALAGMATYLLWPRSAPAGTGLSIVPAASVREVGLVTRGSF